MNGSCGGVSIVLSPVIKSLGLITKKKNTTTTNATTRVIVVGGGDKFSFT